MDDTPEIDIQYPAPVIYRQFAHLADNRNAGIIKHEIQTAMPRQSPVDQILNGALAAHIHDVGLCLPAGTMDGIGGLFGLGRINIRDNNHRPGLCQRLT